MWGKRLGVLINSEGLGIGAQVVLIVVYARE